jgi:hypothetical protein
MALNPRSATPPDDTRPRVPRPHWIAWLFVVASVAVQLFLLSLAWDYRHNDPNCGEKCAWAGMGLVALFSASLWVVLPGLAATLWLLASALDRRRRDGGQSASLAMLGGTLALSALLVVQVALSDRKIARATPVPAEPVLDAAARRRNDEVAGYSWASDNGIMRESDCARGNADFRNGCRKFAHAFSDTTASGQPKHATLRLGR